MGVLKCRLFNHKITIRCRFKGWIGRITLIEISPYLSRTLHFSAYTARDQFSVLKYTHTQQSKCLSSSVSHVNTVDYGLSEHKQVGEN